MNGYAQFKAEPLKPGMFVQFGRGLSDDEIAQRLVMSYAEHITEPVHFIPPIKMLDGGGWPRRGVMNG